MANSDYDKFITLTREGDPEAFEQLFFLAQRLAPNLARIYGLDLDTAYSEIHDATATILTRFVLGSDRWMTASFYMWAVMRCAMKHVAKEQKLTQRGLFSLDALGMDFASVAELRAWARSQRTQGPGENS